MSDDLRRECRRRGISIPAAALEMDLHRETVWRWVEGGVTPSPGYARIVRAWLATSGKKPKCR